MNGRMKIRLANHAPFLILTVHRHTVARDRFLIRRANQSSINQLIRPIPNQASPSLDPRMTVIRASPIKMRTILLTASERWGDRREAVPPRASPYPRSQIGHCGVNPPPPATPRLSISKTALPPCSKAIMKMHSRSGRPPYLMILKTGSIKQTSNVCEL